MQAEVLTIVIPVKDRAHLIGRCLDSVKAQTHRPLTVIVVDNGSVDNTKDVIAQWGIRNTTENLKLILLEEKIPGAAMARNFGLASVKTEWVMFFDSDDVMFPKMIDKITQRITGHPDLDIIYWNCLIESGDKKKSKHRNIHSSKVWERHIYNGLLSTQCYAVKTDFIRKIGGWNNSLTGWDDWELGIRLLLHNPKMMCIPENLALIYPQDDSITGTNYHTKAGIWEKAIDQSEKAVAESSLETVQKNRVLRMLNYRRTNLAAMYAREKRNDLSAPLLKSSLSHHTTTGLRKILLRFIYFYTSAGGRMGYILWS